MLAILILPTKQSLVKKLPGLLFFIVVSLFCSEVKAQGSKISSADLKKLRVFEDTLKDFSYYLITDSLVQIEWSPIVLLLNRWCVH